MAIKTVLLAAALCLHWSARAQDFDSTLSQAQAAINKSLPPGPGTLAQAGVEICCAHLLVNFAGHAPPILFPLAPAHCWIAVVKHMSLDEKAERRVYDEAWIQFISEHTGHDLVEMRRISTNADKDFSRIRERIRERTARKVVMTTEGFPQMHKEIDPVTGEGPTTGPYTWPQITHREGGTCVPCSDCSKKLPPDEAQRKLHERISCVNKAVEDWPIGYYYFTGPNSNTYASFVANRCCTEKANALIVAPGWNSRLPDDPPEDKRPKWHWHDY
ncbi:MAG: hypothetical protein HY077_00230 [Elusimicrobia bacterium]|nr:hypothetical protein [Elusimicrobiota bacterium]